METTAKTTTRKKGSGRKNFSYSIENLCQYVNTNRQSLYYFFKEDEDLLRCLLTSIILLAEKEKGNEIPFKKLSEIFQEKNESCEIDLDLSMINFKKNSFFKEYEETIKKGFVFIKCFKIDYTHLNKFISERNFTEYKIDKIFQETEILKFL